MQNKNTNYNKLEIEREQLYNLLDEIRSTMLDTLNENKRLIQELEMYKSMYNNLLELYENKNIETENKKKI